MISQASGRFAGQRSSRGVPLALMSLLRAPLRALVVVSSLLGSLGSTACDRSASPPESAGSAPPASLAPAAPTDTASASASSSAVQVTSAEPRGAPVAPASSVPSDAGSAIVLVGPDGSPLPQTEDKPSVSSAAFQSRVELVARAIVTGDPLPAHEAFFPLVAYRQVKAIQDPDRDYERRLLKSFDSDIAEYHRALGKEPSGAVFAGVDVAESRAEWMKPGSRGQQGRLLPRASLEAPLHARLRQGKDLRAHLAHLVARRMVRRAPARLRLTPPADF